MSPKSVWIRSVEHFAVSSLNKFLNLLLAGCRGAGVGSEDVLNFDICIFGFLVTSCLNHNITYNVCHLSASCLNRQQFLFNVNFDNGAYIFWQKLLQNFFKFSIIKCKSHYIGLQIKCHRSGQSFVAFRKYQCKNWGMLVLCYSAAAVDKLRPTPNYTKLTQLTEPLTSTSTQDVHSFLFSILFPPLWIYLKI